MQRMRFLPASLIRSNLHFGEWNALAVFPQALFLRSMK
jgi:hypothetical protein